MNSCCVANFFVWNSSGVQTNGKRCFGGYIFVSIVLNNECNRFVGFPLFHQSQRCKKIKHNYSKNDAESIIYHRVRERGKEEPTKKILQVL
jgi:hypothetical protein